MDFTTLQKIQKEGLQIHSTMLSCDWLELKITGKLDGVFMNTLEQMTNSDGSPLCKKSSNATYRYVYELPNYTISYGTRGAVKDSHFIHVKFSNEFLYKTQFLVEPQKRFTSAYQYLQYVENDLFSYIDISRSYVARLDLCLDMPFESEAYNAAKWRFETNTIGSYPKRKLCQSLYKEYFTSSDKYKTNYATGEIKDLTEGVDPCTMTKTKRYNNRGCLAYNYSAGSRQGDFYFRFYDKTLENSGISQHAKKEYIDQIHKSLMPNAKRVYRLECEIKLPYLPISINSFFSIAQDVFGYYFGAKGSDGYIFRPEFTRMRIDEMTAEKKQRLYNALVRFINYDKNLMGIDTNQYFSQPLIKVFKRLGTQIKENLNKDFDFSMFDELDIIMNKADALENPYQNFLNEDF